MTHTSEQAYRINITNPVYAVVTSDTSEGTTYGAVKKFGEAQQIQITASIASGQLYGNGAIVDSSAVLTGLSAQFQTTKLPIETIADIYNQTVTDGVLQEKAGVTANYIALGYEVEQSNGKSEYVWLLKGRPQPIGGTVNQSETNINYSTDTVTIDFVKRVSDDLLRYYADASNEDFTTAQATAWFTNGPASYPKPSNSQANG